MAITDKIHLTEAIRSFGDWNVSILNESLSEIKFRNDAGEVIERPADFPSNSDIIARQEAMQDLIDTDLTLNHKQEVIAKF